MMMSKICKVVDSCSNCDYLAQYQKTGSNCEFAGICEYTEAGQLVLLRGTQLGHSEIVIPDKCPLEDCTGIKTKPYQN